ncbi:conjugal transfer protein, partial [Salmonella sp. 741265055_HSA]
KQTKPRQSGLFKHFTLLIVDFFKERFVWAKRKNDTIDADHDKRIAENYVFDEVLGVNVPRSEFEKRSIFNNDQKSPEAEFCGNVSDNDKTVRFPSRPEQEQPDVDRPRSILPEHVKRPCFPRKKPPIIRSKV